MIFLFLILLGTGSSFVAAHDTFRVSASKSNKAAEWAKVQQSANLGDPEALFSMGSFYFKPPEDSLHLMNHKKSAEYYFQSSLRNHAAAQYNIALMLHRGIGFKRNIIESYVWFYIASINKSHVAKHINIKTAGMAARLKEQLNVRQITLARQKIVAYQAIMLSERFDNIRIPEVK